MQYKRGGDLASLRFLAVGLVWTVGGCRCVNFLQLWCQGARYAVLVRRCGDTFHPPEKLTLYLKVTPFDSKTPTHQRSKVPIGGYVRRSQTAKLPRLPDNKTQ